MADHYAMKELFQNTSYQKSITTTRVLKDEASKQKYLQPMKNLNVTTRTMDDDTCPQTLAKRETFFATLRFSTKQKQRVDIEYANLLCKFYFLIFWT